MFNPGKDLTEDLIWTQCKFANFFFVNVFSICSSSSYFQKDKQLKACALPLSLHSMLMKILSFWVLC